MSTVWDVPWLLANSPRAEELDATAYGTDADQPAHDDQAVLAEQGYYDEDDHQ